MGFPWCTVRTVGNSTKYISQDISLLGVVLLCCVYDYLPRHPSGSGHLLSTHIPTVHGPLTRLPQTLKFVRWLRVGRVYLTQP